MSQIVRQRVVLSATNRLPAASKVKSLAPHNPEAKVLCVPSEVNSKIWPKEGISAPSHLYPVTQRFCAVAPEQIRITAPRHVILNSRPAKPCTELNFVLASVVFTLLPP